MKSDANEILKRFPKRRPPLSERMSEIYAEHYKSNRGGETPASSAAQFLERWMHNKVAADSGDRTAHLPTLEIGAGNLNHLRFEERSSTYDIIEPFQDLFKDSQYISRIRNIYADISEIPREQTYDRIISIATFEHITHLPSVIARAGLLLRPSGCLRVAIPSEGTFLWKMGWKATTGLEFRRKYGLDYGELMRHEHVNTAKEIETLLRYFFEVVEMKVFGICRSLSLYQVFICSSPDKDACNDVM